MKPQNFPERKRQRQLRALARLLRNRDSSLYEISVLQERTADNLRGVRSKRQRQGTRVQRQGNQ